MGREAALFISDGETDIEIAKLGPDGWSCNALGLATLLEKVDAAGKLNSLELQIADSANEEDG